MAIKLRIEEAGAIYHVVNRGNYRRDLFQSGGEARAFQETVMEATGATGPTALCSVSGEGTGSAVAQRIG